MSSSIRTCPRVCTAVLLATCLAAPATAQTPAQSLDALWRSVCAQAQPGSPFFSRCQEILNAGPGSADRSSAAALGNNLGVVAAQGRMGDAPEESPTGGVATESLIEQERWGIFASIHAGNLERDGSDNEAGFDADQFGALLGFDYRFGNGVTGLLALEHRNQDADYDGGAGRLDQTGLGIRGSLYGTIGENGGWLVSLGTEDIEFDIERRIAYALVLNAGTPEQTSVSIAGLAFAQPDGRQDSASVGFDWSWPREAWALRASTGLDWQRLRIDAYAEREAGGLAFAFDEQTVTSLQGHVGLEVSRVNSASWGVWTPYARLDWFHEFRNDPRQIASRFVLDQAGVPVVFGTESPDRSFGAVGAGVSGVFAGGWQAYAGISVTVAH
ncbi:MAG TPA: autotransporter outer membrane beta-barrel domain-containing protein, partial [Xanthomonadaceae bacterium]|nr:autotransporter outer membrane beta-barrel domain-containing protein [Xanthomonadaceae bacterium]